MKKQQEITLYIYNLRVFLMKYNVFETYEDMEYFFTMGGCYIFAKILQRKFKLPIAISHQRNHCGMYLRTSFLNKVFFDIFGPKTNTYYGFEKCNLKNLLYIKEHFGFHHYPKDNFEEYFVNTILDAFEKDENPNIGPLAFGSSNNRAIDTIYINEKGSV